MNPTKNSHSNFKKDLNDYNDGANVTHHLGNDDYKNGSNLEDPFANGDNPLLEGKVAYGNDLVQEDSEDESDDSEIKH